MFTDCNGATFSVTVGAWGGALAVFIAHPRFNGGAAFAVTGCTATPGAFESAQAWAQQFQRELPTALTDLDNNRFELV